jgi:hypothetical protein
MVAGGEQREDVGPRPDRRHQYGVVVRHATYRSASEPARRHFARRALRPGLGPRLLRWRTVASALAAKTVHDRIRQLLAWQITPTFSYDPDLVTELEVLFIAEASGTRVELEHRLDGCGTAAEDMFKVFDGGWQGLLESFAKETA